MSSPFALCPVHNGEAEVIMLGHVGPGDIAFVGLPSAVRRELSPYGAEEAPYFLARPELAPDHPSQCVIVPVRLTGTWKPDDFLVLGDGAFVLGPGMEISRNPQGDICVRNPSASRHTTIIPFTVSRLN